MPKLTIFEGSMDEVINYSRFVNAPYRNRPKPYTRKQPNPNLKELPRANKWERKHDQNTTDNHSSDQESNSDMSIEETNKTPNWSQNKEKERTDYTTSAQTFRKQQPRPSKEDLAKDSYAEIVSRRQREESQRARNVQK
ncbi:SKI family transcriptional corepressor 2 [Frankliniella fusca]|uniref:SKI family transcriptional corepressor 2 n=1 Tax=Frankliniella fusca TaxID=407009 RepID=A0AAE1L8K6_9NEOP|nr:SKI family transcriptional corepressor 2 [Frankliniella fusca]